jgi:hypothetical protein
MFVFMYKEKTKNKTKRHIKISNIVRYKFGSFTIWEFYSSSDKSKQNNY